MFENLKTRKSVLLGAGGLALATLLSGCGPYTPNPSGEVLLPDTTRRINPSVEREAQLRTGTTQDDYPEFTGAPGPYGTWPATVGNSGTKVYRAANSLQVVAEGPGAVTP
ncbi:hypothetical protein [Aliiruegeria lutimaris]|uniref:Uncharacterized protein n=1 Tax=Aliiruegeria lutimaris TaxID=571298 RepID=A0A1G9J245_9RHOB|nr:hypothetical protein [Aliiruegeria lutimaris]SDL31588.1 hypothetical protein SAMN04488026_10783 [Aliiruegeria lutimaris]